MTLAEELAKKHIPPHNAIDPDRPEGHYDCEECADIVFAHAVDAINEALELAAQEAERSERGATSRQQNALEWAAVEYESREIAARIRRLKSSVTPQEP